MKNLAKTFLILAVLALTLILVFSVLYAVGQLPEEHFKVLILCCSLCWFASILLSRFLKKN